jgi:hypothetical protein
MGYELLQYRHEANLNMTLSHMFHVTCIGDYGHLAALRLVRHCSCSFSEHTWRIFSVHGRRSIAKFSLEIRH